MTTRIAESQPMILYQTSLMELNYDASTDILKVKWADFEDINWLEVDYNFRVIRDSIKWYFIKRILVDSSSFNRIPDKALLHQLTTRFLETLYGTTIKKFARVQCGNPMREALATEIHTQLDHTNYLLYSKTFTNEHNAIAWLLEDELDSIS